MIEKTSFHQLSKELINIYGTISEKIPSDNEKSNYIIDCINFLNDFSKINDFVVGNVSEKEIYFFLKLLLDAVGLVSATEGSLQPIKLGNIELISRKRDLKGVYKGNDNSINQNMCATLFRGWIKSNKLPIEISKDLKNIVPKGKRSCDFLIEGNGNQILVECKRIHPIKEIKSIDLIINIIKKSESIIKDAILQFKSMEKCLKKTNSHRHLILDISAYGENRIKEDENYNIIGLSESKEIKQIINHFKAHNPIGIDVITFCWSEIYIFENKPRVLVYRTTPFKINNNTPNLFNYDGWTIEFYPSGKKVNEFKELRISSIARPQSWIELQWYSCSDNLLIIGPEEENNTDK